MVRPAVAPVSPLEIVAADDIIAGWDAAVRVAVAGAVFTLPDVSGNGFNLNQAIALNQPTEVVGGGPNGNDSVLFDGVNDFMNNGALDLPAPGITPTFYWAVMRQVTWTLSDTFWTAGVPGAGRISVQQGPAITPSILQFNGTAGNNTAALILNSYRRLESYYTDSVSDSLKVGSALSSGVNSGGDNPGAGFTVGANASLNIFSNIEICELWIFNILPSIAQRAALDAYVTNRYGIGLV